MSTFAIKFIAVEKWFAGKCCETRWQKMIWSRILWCWHMTLKQQNFLWNFLILKQIILWWYPIWSTGKDISYATGEFDVHLIRPLYLLNSDFCFAVWRTAVSFCLFDNLPTSHIYRHYCVPSEKLPPWCVPRTTTRFQEKLFCHQRSPIFLSYVWIHELHSAPDQVIVGLAYFVMSCERVYIVKHSCISE